MLTLDLSSVAQSHEATKQNQKEENWKAHVVSEKGKQLCGQQEETGHPGADHRGPPAKHVRVSDALSGPA